MGVVVLAACSGSGDEESAFSPSPDAIEVGSTGIYLVDGEPATKPTPTSSDSAPKIVKVTAEQTSEHEFTLTMEVESEQEIAYAYLDFSEHGVYKAPVRAPVAAVDPNASYAEGCRQALASQNISCTDECIAACDCVSCSDSAITKNLKQACAVTCSANVHSGSIDSAPYNGSEKVLADVVYNGSADIGLPGTATQSGCNATQCAASGASEKKSNLHRWTVSFEAPNVPQLTPLVAPQVQADDRVTTSEQFAPAQISLCKQGNAIPCR